MDGTASIINSDDVEFVPSVTWNPEPLVAGSTQALLDETPQQEAMQTAKKKRDYKLVHYFSSFKSSY